MYALSGFMGISYPRSFISSKSTCTVKRHAISYTISCPIRMKIYNDTLMLMVDIREFTEKC